jgi:hypothetical protein
MKKNEGATAALVTAAPAVKGDAGTRLLSSRSESHAARTWTCHQKQDDIEAAADLISPAIGRSLLQCSRCGAAAAALVDTKEMFMETT